MTIEPIGAASIALYLTPADLREYGLTPGGLTLEQTLALTREACLRSTTPPAGDKAIEAHAGYRSIMVFAHIRPAGPLWFVFDSLEPLIGAALELHCTPVDAALWWREGRYWLALPAGAEGAAAVCQEFGAQRQLGKEEAARLEAEGQIVFPHHALACLCRDFLRLHL